MGRARRNEKGQEGSESEVRGMATDCNGSSVSLSLTHTPARECIQHGGFALVRGGEVVSLPELFHALGLLFYSLGVGGEQLGEGSAAGSGTGGRGAGGGGGNGWTGVGTERINGSSLR